MANCLLCRPISSIWDFSVKGSCGDHKSLDQYIATMNLVQDFIVIILPMPILWRLQMGIKKKLALSGIFGIGVAYGLTIPYAHSIDRLSANMILDTGSVR